MPAVPQASQSSPTPQVPGSTDANIHPGNTTGNMEPSTSTTTLDDDAEAVSERASVMPCNTDVAKHRKRIQDVTLLRALRPDVGRWVTLSPRYWAGEPSDTMGAGLPTRRFRTVTQVGLPSLPAV